MMELELTVRFFPPCTPVLLTFKMFSVCKDFFHGVYAATAVS